MKIRPRVWLLYTVFLAVTWWYQLRPFPGIAGIVASCIIITVWIWAPMVTNAVYVGNKIRAKKAENAAKQPPPHRESTSNVV